jgi:hypothetical protein
VYILVSRPQNIRFQVVGIEKRPVQYAHECSIESACKDGETTDKRNFNIVLDDILVDQRDDVIVATHDSIDNVCRYEAECDEQRFVDERSYGRKRQ